MKPEISSTWKRASELPWSRSAGEQAGSLVGFRKLNADLKSGSLSADKLCQHAVSACAGLGKSLGASLEPGKISGNASSDISANELKKESKTPLAQIPFALKDFILKKDWVSSAASKILSDFRAPYSATCLERLENAGALCVARTNMDEFGMGSSNENSAWGNVKNPWDTSRTPGGSSGGSAALVAAGCVPLALGTDTGGSVRQPAAFCGVTGLKPSYGRISRYGVISFASSLDQVGVLSVDAFGCAKALEAMSGEDARDGTCSKKESFVYKDLIAAGTSKEFYKAKRIAIPRSIAQAQMDDEVAAGFKDFQDFLKNQGATVDVVDMPLLPHALSVYYLICTSEASSNLSRYNGVHLGASGAIDDNLPLHQRITKFRSENFGEEVKRRILLGTFALSSGYYDAYFKKAARVRRLIQQDFERVFQSYDLILTPTSLELPFKLGERNRDPLKMYNSDVCTIPASLAGLPAISFPCAVGGSLPVGMQFIAPYWNEQEALAAADVYQQSPEGYFPYLAGELTDKAAAQSGVKP